MVLWFCLVIIVMVTVTKFMFICVWKSMRTMNDDLMVRITINLAVLSSIVMGLLKLRAQVSNVYDADFKSNHEFYFIVCVGSWVTQLEYISFVNCLLRVHHREGFVQLHFWWCQELGHASQARFQKGIVGFLFGYSFYCCSPSLPTNSSTWTIVCSIVWRRWFTSSRDSKVNS